jgi:hypothetical protein
MFTCGPMTKTSSPAVAAFRAAPFLADLLYAGVLPGAPLATEPALLKLLQAAPNPKADPVWIRPA